MAYDRQFLRLTFGFTVEGTSEIANTGLTYASVTGWTGAEAALIELDTITPATSIRTAFQTFMETTQAQWAAYSNLNYLKIAAVGTDGDYLDFPTNPILSEDPSPASGSSQNILPQSSIVVSLRSGLFTGTANYGRMYLPHTKIAQATDAPIGDPTSALAVANAAKVFVNATTAIINAEISATVFPTILSSVGTGAGKIVASIAVGAVTDIQRRRRNKLEENYQFVTL